MLFHLSLVFTLLIVKSSLSLPNSFSLSKVTEPVDHAEGPFWDPRSEMLYFVDIHNGKVYSYNYNNNAVNYLSLGGDVAIVVPSKQNPNLLIVARNRSVLAVEWNGNSNKETAEQILTTVAENFPTSRFNDGKADKEGRLWFGTMGYENSSGVLPNEGSLYHINKNNLANPQIVISPVNISNGMAWNSANNKFYYIDTPTDLIMEYDYDNSLGTISNPRVAFNVAAYSSQITGHPDGMTIDADDNLWIALYNGGAVIKANPVSGELLDIIPIPAAHVTSVAFGGPNLNILFVTTSRYTLTAEERLQQSGAGAVWAVSNLGTTGVAAYEADVIDSLNGQKAGRLLISATFDWNRMQLRTHYLKR